MIILPAIDIKDGNCVRLFKGDYATVEKVAESPYIAAQCFADAGAEWMHMVDLDGAKAGHIVNYKVLEKIATKTELTIDFGGGLKQDKDLEIAFDCGASMVTGGSIAVKSPEVFTQWIERFGPDRIILGADAKDGKIAIEGWEKETSHELLEFVTSYFKKGIRKVICTDIKRDGMLQGPATDLYSEMLQEIPELYLIASGGVSSLDDIVKLNEAGVPGVIFGKAIYEGRISLKDLESFVIGK